MEPHEGAARGWGQEREARQREKRRGRTWHRHRWVSGASGGSRGSRSVLSVSRDERVCAGRAGRQIPGDFELQPLERLVGGLHIAKRYLRISPRFWTQILRPFQTVETDPNSRFRDSKANSLHPNTV
jgi:hypothetical protein